ncbi:hypothetical protein [Pseudomonas fluorescens]|uniref:AbiTii domain-containing protein n=1 Tax=Pseudomonas fluorescens TaxID=294 RepID=UPI001913B6A1
MCKLLAARISHRALRNVDHELIGYPNGVDFRNYRVVRVDSYGSFAGDFHHVNRLQIPVSILPSEFQENYRHSYFSNSISAYTAYFRMRYQHVCNRHGLA